MFTSWSDGGAQTHNIVAPATPTTYTATFSNAGPPVHPRSRAAAYVFDEGTGTTATDASGNDNVGTSPGLPGRRRAGTAARLSFDGGRRLGLHRRRADARPDDRNDARGVGLPDRAQPLAGDTVMLKEQPGEHVYALYANDGPNVRRRARLHRRRDRRAARRGFAPAQHLDAPRSHLRRRRRCGCSSTAPRSATLGRAGVIATSDLPLRIGGNTIWPEWFQGHIDDVRVYNRALTAAEIQADMNTPVPPPPPTDTTPPTAPTDADRAGALGQAQLNWTAATRQRRRRRYNVHRCTTAGFLPGPATGSPSPPRPATPTPPPPASTSTR